MNDYVITVSAEYLDPVKDALYCEAASSPARRSVQTALYEMTRTLATWMAPVLCFTAQDVADELARVTGEPFDVHASVRDEIYPPGKAPANPNKRWTDEIRPRREAILRPLEKFRAEGHKSLEARVRVTPAAAERPHWQWNLDHLTELCVVSRVELDPADAPAGAETTVVVDEAPGRPARAAGGAPATPRRPARPIPTSAGAAPPRSPPAPGAPHDPHAPQVPAVLRVHAGEPGPRPVDQGDGARGSSARAAPSTRRCSSQATSISATPRIPGVAFSMLQDLPGGRVLLTLLAVAAFALVIVYLRKTPLENARLHVALGLVGGGAIGNLIDRAMYGKVTDFIVWKKGIHEWPAFNIADAALCVGVGLMLLDMIIAWRNERATA